MRHSVIGKKARCNSCLSSIGGIAGIMVAGMTSPVFSEEQCTTAAVHWQISLGDLDLRAATFTADGRQLVVGAGAPQPGPHNENAQTPHDAALLAIDWQTGEIDWETHVSGDGAREITAVTTTPGGDVVALGQLGFTPVPIGGFQDEFAWAARLNPAGDILWERPYGSAGKLHGFFDGLAFEDESVLFAGWTELSSHEHDDGYDWLVRVEPNGEYRWDVPLDWGVLGLLPRNQTSTIVLFGKGEGDIDFWDIDGGGKLFPWGGISTGLGDIWVKDIWTDGEIEHARTDNILIHAMLFDETDDKDIIFRMDEDGDIRWDRVSAEHWPAIGGVVGTPGDLLVLPIGVETGPFEQPVNMASELLVLDALTGENKGILRTDLAHMVPHGVVTAQREPVIALFGADIRTGEGLLARVAINCE